IKPQNLLKHRGTEEAEGTNRRDPGLRRDRSRVIADTRVIGKPSSHTHHGDTQARRKPGASTAENAESAEESQSRRDHMIADIVGTEIPFLTPETRRKQKRNHKGHEGSTEGLSNQQISIRPLNIPLAL